jgi:hypothetical protein
MHYLAGIFALFTAAAGWFYMFYSGATKRLAAIENQRLNAQRAVLRRAGGAAMFLLGAFFFAGFYAFDDPKQSPTAFLAVWLTVFALLILVIVLAMIDLRLTRRLRASQKGSQP